MQISATNLLAAQQAMHPSGQPKAATPGARFVPQGFEPEATQTSVAASPKTGVPAQPRTGLGALLDLIV